MGVNDRFIKQNESGGWDVTKVGHRRATAHASTKGAALSKAAALTRHEGGGEVAVLNRTGKVVSAKTVTGAAAPARRSA